MKKILLAAMVAIVLTGCKPTEKNYRAAYDAAISKRQAADDALASDGLISEDGPRSRNINGKEYFFLQEFVKVADGYDKLKPVSVVVGKFKMSTNASSGVESLREKGYDASLARGLGDKWFIVAGSFDTLAEAAGFIDMFRNKNPKFSYIGIGVDQPAIIK